MTKLILSGLMLLLCFIVNAAIVQPLEIKKSPAHFFITMKNNEKPRKVNNIIEEIFSNKPKSQATEPTKIVTNRFKKLIKNLTLEHNENLLFQESLATLYDAKQLWNAVNETTNRFSSDISSALDVEQLVNTNLKRQQQQQQQQQQQSLTNPNITALSATYLSNISLLGSSNNQHIQNIRKIREIERAEKETLNAPLELVTFSIEAIYYIIGIALALFLLQTAIKMILP